MADRKAVATGRIMETHTFFLHLLIILLSARIVVELAVRLNVPAVIGEMAEFGIILAPFSVGLESHACRRVDADENPPSSPWAWCRVEKWGLFLPSQAT